MKVSVYALLLIIVLSACSKSEPPPNIIYILADDMGYGDIGYLNENAGVTTPHLDRLGQEGMYFTDAHSPSGVCTPTRYGILTGRYSFKTRLKSGVLVGHSKSLIDSATVTVAEFLRDRGYQTGAIGKWHLGLDWAKVDPYMPLFSGSEWDIRNTSNVDYKGTVGGGPVDHGFTYSWINPASLDIAPYVYVSNGKVTAPIAEHIEGYNEERGVFWRHGDRAEDFEIAETLDVFGQKAVDFIDKHSKSENPFFLYLPLTAPHTPWVPSAEFSGSSKAGTYGDFVQHVDNIVGKVLEALDKNGVSENTLVIFTSDNGAHWTREDKKKFTHRANFKFRGMKSDIWEGGHRVPFLVRWPKEILAGSISDETTCLTDLLATSAAILDEDLPKGAGEDSYSILPALKGESYEGTLRPYTIHHSISGQFAIRKGKWKLIDHPGSGGWSNSGQGEEHQQQLYDMDADPSEENNLILEHPEIVSELDEIVQSLKEEYKAP